MPQNATGIRTPESHFYSHTSDIGAGTSPIELTGVRDTVRQDLELEQIFKTRPKTTNDLGDIALQNGLEHFGTQNVDTPYDG